jgi:3'-phosphoadenosine 5'-phosphosulfate (PAPS) 3'-phosphatase
VTEEQAESHSVTANILIVDPLDGTKDSSTVVAIFTVAYVHDGCRFSGVVTHLPRAVVLPTRPAIRLADWTKNTVGTGPDLCFAPDNTGLMVVASKSHRDQATDDNQQIRRKYYEKCRVFVEILSGRDWRGGPVPHVSVGRWSGTQPPLVTRSCRCGRSCLRSMTTRR